MRKIEAEQRRPSEQIVGQIAEAFRIPPEELESFLKFARGDWRAAPPGAIEADAPWRVSNVSHRSSLPATVTSLIGRAEETAQARAYLQSADIRLVTLTGPPGIGKTQLSLATARELAADFPDGVYFVPLAPLHDSSLIPSTLIRALGFIEGGYQITSQQVLESIGERKMLLVLDNCEHLIDEVALLASALLSACARIKILATSRQALHIPGEWLLEVPPLGVPSEASTITLESISEFPALTLFAERARAVQSDFAIDAGNVRSIASICRQLDGLPLALELLAARIRLMSPHTISERLRDQLPLSTDGKRGIASRQRSLHNAVAWSYDLLSGEEQKLLSHLSVFSGGFTLEAAEKIHLLGSSDGLVLHLISSLLDKSLIQRTFDASGEPRFNMLVTIQQFALERLEESGAAGQARDGHLDYFLGLAENADKEIHGPNQTEWLDRLETEHENIRAALKWCVSEQKTEIALRLLVFLGWPWFMRDHTGEYRTWFDRVCALPGAADYPVLYAGLLNHQGYHCWIAADFREAASVLRKAEKIGLALGREGEPGLAKTFDMLGLTLMAGEGVHQAARSLYERSLELYREHEDKWGMATATVNLGIMAQHRNDDTRALSLFAEGLELFHQIGDGWGVGRACHLLGYLYLDQGDFEKARQSFERFLGHRKGHKIGTMVALTALGDSYRRQHDYRRAERYYERSLGMSRKHGLHGFGEASYALAMLGLHQDKYRHAEQFFLQYFNPHRGSSDKPSVCDFLMGLAAVAAGSNRPHRAGKLYGAALSLLETMDYQIESFDQAEMDRHIQLARNQLGDTVFESVESEGRSMTMEQAIRFALEDAGK